MRVDGIELASNYPRPRLSVAASSNSNVPGHRFPVKKHRHPHRTYPRDAILVFHGEFVSKKLITQFLLSRFDRLSMLARCLL